MSAHMYHDKLTMAQPISYQRLLGRNVREQRLKLGLRQDDVARQAQALGLHWTQATVAAIETGRRQVSLGEALLVASMLGRSLVDLLEAPGRVSVDVEGVTLTRSQLLRLASGEGLKHRAMKGPTVIGDA